MAQLQKLLGSMRQNNNILPIPELDSVDSALDALGISQGSSLIASIRIRLHLIDLVELYKQKRMQYQRDSHQAFTDPETYNTYYFREVPTARMGCSRIQASI
jgi:hypothetical protein